MALTLSEQLAHSTVRIECDLADGIGTGTGFFYSIGRSREGHIPVIITNKHVIRGAIKGRFLMTLLNSDGMPLVGSAKAYELDNFEQRWVPHPDPGIDLCAMPIGPLLQQAEKAGEKFFCPSMDRDLIPSASEIEDMIGLEEIVMIGYPNGLWDEINNLPIFRRGVLATDFKRNWNGKKEFLIDAACFPGSSGSPVMLVDVGGYQTKKGTFMGSHRIKLLGVLYAGPQQTIEGEIKIIDVPAQQKAVSYSSMPINLGIIIKSEQLLAFESMFK